MSEQKPAIELAKAKKENVSDEFEVYGVRVKLVAVPVGVVQDALAYLEPPKVPKWMNEEKGREENNPNDPDYVAAVEKYEQQQGIASMETMAMFGIELPDGLPQDDSWLKKIKYLAKRGTLNLDNVDWNDETEIEFLFKRYVVATVSVVAAIGQKTGVTQESIAQAKAGFRR